MSKNVNCLTAQRYCFTDENVPSFNIDNFSVETKDFIVWSEYHVPDVCYYLHDVFQLTNGEFKAICNKQTSVCVQWFDLQQKIEWVWQSRP